MVNGGKVFDDVSVETVAVATYPSVTLIQRPMSPSSHPAGVTGVDKARFPDRLNDVAQSVVHHSVAEWCRTDQTTLWLIDIKVVVRARVIGLVTQFSLELQQVSLHIKLKGGYLDSAPFAPASLAVREVEVFEGIDLRIKVFVGLYGSLHSLK